MMNGGAMCWAEMHDSDTRETRQALGEHPQPTEAASCTRNGEANHRAASHHDLARNAWRGRKSGAGLRLDAGRAPSNGADGVDSALVCMAVIHDHSQLLKRSSSLSRKHGELTSSRT